MPVAGEVFPPLDDQATLAVERRLAEVAQRFDGSLRDRVTLLLLAAAEAIVKLADLDLVRYEAGDEEGGHTLAVWEEIAPVMGDTVEHVNEEIRAALCGLDALDQRTLDEVLVELDGTDAK